MLYAVSCYLGDTISLKTIIRLKRAFRLDCTNTIHYSLYFAMLVHFLSAQWSRNSIEYTSYVLIFILKSWHSAINYGQILGQQKEVDLGQQNRSGSNNNGWQISFHLKTTEHKNNISSTPANKPAILMQKHISEVHDWVIGFRMCYQMCYHLLSTKRERWDQKTNSTRLICMKK